MSAKCSPQRAPSETNHTSDDRLRPQPHPRARSYFDQGLRFTSTFKFDYAAQSHIAALGADPGCAMCEWGLALAYGQNLNDALVMSLEPWFLDNVPLAHQAVRRAQDLLVPSRAPGDGAGAGSSAAEEAEGLGDTSPGTVTARRERDAALVSALALKFVPTVEEYRSHFVDGLPASLNRAYAEAMADAAVRSEEEGWPDHPLVLVLTADAWMNLSPWDCEFPLCVMPKPLGESRRASAVRPLTRGRETTVVAQTL